MTKLGHQLTGIGVCGIAYGLGARLGGIPLVAAIGAFLGATAPDWLEIPYWLRGRRLSLIPHRTITHWLPAWVVLLLASTALLAAGKGEALYSALFGFAVGGLTHLAMDIPNPMGVPVVHPFRRTSLNWWKSGEWEWVLVPLTWAFGAALTLTVI